MMVKLGASAVANVIPGNTLHVLPRWGPASNSLKLGPYHSADEHERHVLETIGSTEFLWTTCDELRFGRDDLLLQSVLFHVPEVNISSDDWFTAWHDLQPQVGVLHLESAGDFNQPPTDVRWIDPNGEQLVCVSREALVDSKDRVRLRIATDVELLFVNQILSGWLLSHPARYIVESWEEPYTSEPDTGFQQLLREYILLVAEPFIEQMENEDPIIREALLDLLARLKEGYESLNQAKILCKRIEGILEEFYGNTAHNLK